MRGMIKISKDEFEDLKSSAKYLTYYWHIFRGMDTEGKINFEHSFFIRDFITNNRFEEVTNVKYSKHFNKVLISREQYAYLTECVDITEQLKNVVTNMEKQSHQ